jgi:predicted transcriptional regulator
MCGALSETSSTQLLNDFTYNFIRIRRTLSGYPCVVTMKDIFRLLLASRKIRLGPLEERLLSAIWRRPDGITIRELRDLADVPRAYMTIVTTLNRLRKKGLVDRIALEGTKVVTFRYVPRYTMAEVERDVASKVIRQLLGLDIGAPLLLSRMVEEISKHDAELLDELGRLVDEKRRYGPK